MALVLKGEKQKDELIELERFDGYIGLGIGEQYGKSYVSARFYDSGVFEIFCEEKQEWIKGRWKK